VLPAGGDAGADGEAAPPRPRREGERPARACGPLTLCSLVYRARLKRQPSKPTLHPHLPHTRQTRSKCIRDWASWEEAECHETEPRPIEHPQPHPRQSGDLPQQQSGDLQAPDYLQDLAVCEPLCSGPAATVYRGRWHAKPVAVKVMQTKDSEREAAAHAMEMAVLSCVQHPNVVQAFTHFADMVEVPGDALSSWPTGERAPLFRAAPFLQLCLGTCPCRQPTRH
jgi:hypothetical protein